MTNSFGSIDNQKTPFFKDWVEANKDTIEELSIYPIERIIVCTKGLLLVIFDDSFNCFIFKGQTLHKTLMGLLEENAGKQGFHPLWGIQVDSIENAEYSVIEVPEDKVGVVDTTETSTGKLMYFWKYVQPKNTLSSQAKINDWVKRNSVKTKRQSKRTQK